MSLVSQIIKRETSSETYQEWKLHADFDVDARWELQMG